VKKLFSILLLFIYLPAVSGVSVDSFYCCGKLSSVHFHLGEDAAASNTLKKYRSQNDHLNCCEHIVQSFKIQDAQQQSTGDTDLHIAVLQPALSPFFLTIPVRVLSEAGSYNKAYLKSRPPIGDSLPLFISDESFLI